MVDTPGFLVVNLIASTWTMLSGPPTGQKDGGKD
jgi:hypothetical protein